MIKQDGLAWIPDTFDLVPRWTAEPRAEALESLARRSLILDGHARCEVQFHAQGAFNKLYKVNTDNGAFIMRVSLPVDPHHKTMSEVATMEFVRQKKETPVPRIIAFDASNGNELGFEWILMELLPGQPLRARWRKLPMRAKEQLVKQLVRHQAELFQSRFDGIGNLYQASTEASGPVMQWKADSGSGSSQWSSDADDLPCTLGRIVSLIFFWGDHQLHEVPRGPFGSSHDWLATRLAFVLTDQTRILRDSDDEDDIEDAEHARDIAQRLQEMLPSIFPQGRTAESTSLYHDDLSMQNILVDEAGNLTAVIDWESRHCSLVGRDRADEPRREAYAADEPDDDDGGEEAARDALDNEGVSGLYWEHLMEYEQTKLRLLFVSEMERLQPAWVEEWKNGALKADFEAAVHNSDDCFCFKRILKWLDAYDCGDIWGLREFMME